LDTVLHLFPSVTVPPFFLLPFLLPLAILLISGASNEDEDDRFSHEALAFLRNHNGTWTEKLASLLQQDANESALQPFWKHIVKNYPDTASHFLFPSVLGMISFFVTCVYFTAKDLNQDLTTKTQPEHFPTVRDMLAVAIPQFLIYTGANSLSWICFPWHVELPSEAPSLLRLFIELSVCFIIGDLLIYINHRTMHYIPFLRNHIHSVHHLYHHPFSWAGGWVHPLEDAIVVLTQITAPVAIKVHPLSFWVFIILWVALLIEEHSGHDVWWSPWAWLPFGWGGGAVPHDIHHVKPLKNYGFVLCVWDQLFGTFEAPRWNSVKEMNEELMASEQTPQIKNKVN